MTFKPLCFLTLFLFHSDGKITEIKFDLGLNAVLPLKMVTAAAVTADYLHLTNLSNAVNLVCLLINSVINTGFRHCSCPGHCPSSFMKHYICQYSTK